VKLLKYLFHTKTADKLPRMSRQYSTDYRPADVDADTVLLMRHTHARSPQGATLLKRRHRLQTARELIHYLPSQRRRRRNVGARIMSAIRRAAGTTSYDPMRSIVRQHMRSGKR
jgi:hypothetical protein